MNGLKRAEPDVQRQFTSFDSSGANPRDGLFRKMQAGSWGGNCARLSCEDRLIALAVRVFVLAVDIRRQGNVSQAFHVLLRVFAIAAHKPQRSDPEFSTRNNLGFEFSRTENDSFPDR